MACTQNGKKLWDNAMVKENQWLHITVNVFWWALMVSGPQLCIRYTIQISSHHNTYEISGLDHYNNFYYYTNQAGRFHVWSFTQFTPEKKTVT